MYILVSKGKGVGGYFLDDGIGEIVEVLLQGIISDGNSVYHSV